jgi:hypothetical protein
LRHFANVPPLAPTACMIFVSLLSHHPSPSLSLFLVIIIIFFIFFFLSMSAAVVLP